MRLTKSTEACTFAISVCSRNVDEAPAAKVPIHVEAVEIVATDEIDRASWGNR